MKLIPNIELTDEQIKELTTLYRITKGSEATICEGITNGTIAKIFTKHNKIIPASIKNPRGGYCSQLFVKNNIYITTGQDYGYIYKYNNRTGSVDEALDYSIGKQCKLIGSDNSSFYFKSKDNLIYKVNTEGDSNILIGADDIDNIDGKIINIDAINYLTSSISSNGIIYYWDINYNCIRQLNHK